jgi:hypothetical protein
MALSIHSALALLSKTYEIALFVLSLVLTSISLQFAKVVRPNFIDNTRSWKASEILIGVKFCCKTA